MVQKYNQECFLVASKSLKTKLTFYLLKICSKYLLCIEIYFRTKFLANYIKTNNINTVLNVRHCFFTQDVVGEYFSCRFKKYIKSQLLCYHVILCKHVRVRPPCGALVHYSSRPPLQLANALPRAFQKTPNAFGVSVSDLHTESTICLHCYLQLTVTHPRNSPVRTLCTYGNSMQTCPRIIVCHVHSAVKLLPPS